jgi:hypothetical protein
MRTIQNPTLKRVGPEIQIKRLSDGDGQRTKDKGQGTNDKGQNFG